MYCKKCKFHSFDHVSACPKCGADWEEARKALYLNWISATGINWLAQDAVAQPAAESSSMPHRWACRHKSRANDSAADYLAAPAPPATTAASNTGIDVSNFPELDFSMAEATPEPPAKTPQPVKSEPAPKPEEDLFLDTLPADDMVELDFSASFDTPAAPKAPAPAKAKREDLFIPELEEMLAPMDEEPRSKPAQPKKSSFSEETEILLDFGTDSTKSSSKSMTTCPS
jgi:hypothetical protein